MDYADKTGVSKTRQNLTHEEALNKFKQELVISGYSERTLEMYLCYANEMLKFIKKKPENIERDDVVGYLAYKKTEQKATGSTLGLVYSALKFFFHNFMGMRIMDDIKKAKKSKKLPTVLTKEEIRLLIDTAVKPQDKLIIEFLYSTGARVSECVNLKVDNLQLDQHTATIRGGKGDKDRLIILSTKWIEKIKHHIRDKKPQSDYVFSKVNGSQYSVDYVQKMIRITKAKAGITKHVTPHSLRHSYATHLLEAGESIRKIQELLGHADLSTTQIYTKVSTEELKKVISPLDSM